ncbi:MAG TPA: hypothetical protein DCE42_08905 [Myxococcales bacterium]|nr:hypothetical protein [Deltaproteobacteria bacterium]HAA54865.1 hypothetical protein [Myxococcales bacterium]|tara:strand:- start:538 stop:1548 length:1011 start_codon:yes stop_codon:yes gene_type:complete
MVYTVHLGRWEVSLDQEKSIAEDVEQRDQIERAKERKWTGRSRGNPLGYRIFAWLLQFFGLRAAYTLLFFVGMYYMFFAPSTLRASSEYLQKIHGPLPWWKRLWMNYNHILYFGQVIIDRMAGAMGVIGTQLHFTEDGVEKIEEMMQLDTGAILLSAHVGNWDLAGRMLTGKVDKKIHVVMLQAEAEQLQGFFDSINSQPSFEIIPIQEGMSAVMKIISALEKGDIVCLHGDRSLEGGRTVTAAFLGQNAAFPLLPFMLSSSLEVPVYHMFATKKTWTQYDLKATGPHLCERLQGESKQDARKRWVQFYVEQLEHIVKKYPYQWFNFYPFWDGEES